MTRFFLITGASGAGKSSVLKALLADPTLQVQRFVTTTTRDMRPGEVDGKDYWFISKKEFEEERERGEFFEWADVYGEYYGSHRKEYSRLSKQVMPVVMIVDVQGARTLKRQIPNAITIFIDAPLKELESRLKERGTPAEALQKRVLKMKTEKRFKSEADYVVTNAHGKLDKAVQDTKKIIQEYA